MPENPLYPISSDATPSNVYALPVDPPPFNLEPQIYDDKGRLRISVVKYPQPPKEDEVAQNAPPSDPWSATETAIGEGATKAGEIVRSVGTSAGKALEDLGKEAKVVFTPVDDDPFSSFPKPIKKLFGIGGEERYQMWPEKMVRSGLSLPEDVRTGKQPLPGNLPGNISWDDPRAMEAIGRVQDMAGLSGLSGLTTGAATEATLGSAPFLRPALKYQGKIYKAPMKPESTHLDAIPADLYPEFQRQALSGEDITNFNFGFMNHKGQFLSREAALDYAVKEGLIDPRDARYGTLTTTLMAEGKPGVAIEALAKSRQPFYSAVENAVESINQPRMNAQQWLSTIANKPGVKPEELEWTGLRDWLNEQKGSVTKEAVHNFMNENRVQVNEITKSNLTAQEQVRLDELSKRAFRDGRDNLIPAYQEELKNLENKANNTRPKYQSYQLPGGENYREMLLTLPNKNQIFHTAENVKPASAETVASFGDRNAQMFHYVQGPDNVYQIPKSKYPTMEDAINYVINEKKPTPPADQYRSSHWDEPNVLAHVRMNDRVINGKKTLHIEEIQSDWHQQGREKGYKGQQLTNDEMKELNDLRSRNNLTKEENKRYAELLTKHSADNSGVPDAPFKTTSQWTDLALKRIIRKAAEEGYDAVSWTSGAANRTNPKVMGQTGEAAEKADKGMREYYDDIVPLRIKKLTKQEVKEGSIPIDSTPRSLRHFLDWAAEQGDKRSRSTLGEVWAKGENDPLVRKFINDKKQQSVNYIDLPQSLKDTAMHKGFALFLKGGIPLTPVEYHPWEDK